MFTKTKIYKSLDFIIKAIILFFAYYFIYDAIFKQNKLKNIFSTLQEGLSTMSIWFLILALILVFVNWTIETKKWRMLIIKIEQISFFKAFQAVLAGLTISIFTPNRIGEFFGRAFILRKRNIPAGIMLTIISSFSQLLITLTMGTIALFYFIQTQDVSKYLNPQQAWIIQLFAFILLLLFFILFFNVSKLVFLSTKIKNRKIAAFFKVLQWYSRKELAILLLWSFSRYLVFSFQFYLLFLFFGFNPGIFVSLILTSLIYYIVAAIPSIALAEIGIRGSVSIFVFGLYFSSSFDKDMATIILSASSLIWLINLIIPAIFGSISLLRIKYIK